MVECNKMISDYLMMVNLKATMKILKKKSALVTLCCLATIIIINEYKLEVAN